jgi:hypothetical protein
MKPLCNDSFAKLPFPIPPYNGKYDPAAYLDWELAVEQKFSCHDLPASSQVKAAISALLILLYIGGVMNKKPLSPLGLN